MNDKIESMARLTREQSQALTREKLLRSAEEVVARYGYEGASVERIAEEAGFSKGAFYSNFSSKEDILLQLLEGHAGQDVKELAELLGDMSDQDLILETVTRWSDARGAELKWGIIAIEFLRRAHHDGKLNANRERHLFIRQWEDVGTLLIQKLSLDSSLNALDVGGIVLELTYGGISGFLRANTPGDMIRLVLKSLISSSQMARAD